MASKRLREVHAHLRAKLRPESTPRQHYSAVERIRSASRCLDSGACPNGCGPLHGDSCPGCGFVLTIACDPVVDQNAGYFRKPSRGVNVHREVATWTA